MAHFWTSELFAEWGRCMKRKKIRIIIWVILLPMAAYIAYGIFCAEMTSRCEMTVLPRDLAPEEVIYRLAEYWSSGNERGISMLCTESFDMAVSDMPYSFYEGVIRKDVKITECSEITDETTDGIYPQFYDKHYYRVIWDSDNIEPDWRSGGFAFFLIAKEVDDENAPYKICSLVTGL